MRAPAEYADITADVLARIRSRAPRVHCITNSVAQAYTANMLLAAGAIPSMTISPEEIAAFVAGADALLVNLGTFDGERRAAIELALGALGIRHVIAWLDFGDMPYAKVRRSMELMAGPVLSRLKDGPGAIET